MRALLAASMCLVLWLKIDVQASRHEDSLRQVLLRHQAALDSINKLQKQAFDSAIYNTSDNIDTNAVGHYRREKKLHDERDWWFTISMSGGMLIVIAAFLLRQRKKPKRRSGNQDGRLN
jgi:hypothetical protein